MTIWQIIGITCAYLVGGGVVVYFTRPTSRRILGALTGGAVVGVYGLAVIFAGNSLGVWVVPMTITPIYLALFYIGFAISITPLYLVTWRIGRRFGFAGLAIFTLAVTILGPPRDYAYAAMFPEWMVFAPGVIPVIADAAAYFGIVVLGHAVMRVVAGPANFDVIVRT